MGFFKGYRIGLAVAGAAALAGAHLGNTVNFSTQGPYRPGDTVTVSWAVTVQHNGINVDFSSDGKSWTTVKSGIPKSGPFTYKWVIPNSPTQQGRIRICQMAGSATCTDAQNTSAPGTSVNGLPYVLISSNFTIAATTALVENGKASTAFRVAVSERKWETVFILEKDAEVAVQALDLQGRVRATLISRRYQAGEHRISTLIPGAIGSAESLVFRFRAGDIESFHAPVRP